MNVADVKCPSNTHSECLLPPSKFPQPKKRRLNSYTSERQAGPSEFNIWRISHRHMRRHEMASTQADRRTTMLVLAGLDALESEREEDEED